MTVGARDDPDARSDRTGLRNCSGRRGHVCRRGHRGTVAEDGRDLRDIDRPSSMIVLRLLGIAARLSAAVI